MDVRGTFKFHLLNSVLMSDKKSALKLYGLSFLVGVLCGFILVPYRYLIEMSFPLRELLFRQGKPLYMHFVVIIGMTFVALLLSKFVQIAPLVSGSGIPQVKGVIWGRFKYLHSLRDLVLKFIGGVVGISMGFSLGREGPSVQAGSYIADIVGKIFKANPVERRYLLIGGASSGLSAAFTAPLASAVFAVEELQYFFNPSLMISALLGSVSSGYLAGKVFKVNPYLNIPRIIPTGLSIFQLLLIFLVFGLFFGIIGKIFSFLLLFLQKYYGASKIPKFLKLGFVVCFTYLIGITFIDLTAGGETFLVKEAMTSNGSLLGLAVIILVKIFFTALCYSTGVPGGIFLPLLVIGGLSGKFFTILLSKFGILSLENIGFFVLIGMACAFIVIVRSPVTGMLLILEMTSDFTLLPSMIATGIFAYSISLLMGVKPVYDELYKRLIPNDLVSGEKIGQTFEVEENSYFADKKVSEVVLPEGAKIEFLQRKGHYLDLKEDPEIQTEDLVTIMAPKKDAEMLYDVFREMAKEE